jgi:hypothetical protein
VYPFPNSNISRMVNDLLEVNLIELLIISVLRPGPAWRVNPGPGQPGPRTGPGEGKNPLGN